MLYFISQLIDHTHSFYPDCLNLTLVINNTLIQEAVCFFLQVDRLSRLAALVAALLDFHRNAHRILLGLHGNLQAR